ncbi:rod shape-determining protein MreC [Vibrio sp. qd031]|uniref:rod shape-determining protein MreC n=1 Tax=Vibrio sp. qd031 TaxID=1603038 RepID=UPI000A10D98D|nr:rod shape-determining protein MreC [Vibrio sp. qd031]
MNPIFGRGPSLQFRLFTALLLSASLMLADSRLDAFASVRYLLNSSVAPIQYLANMPRTMFDGVYERFSAKQSLLNTNKALRSKLLLLESDNALLDQYKEENERLRKLLGSPFVRDERKVVTEVMAVDSSTYQDQVVIDKGRVDGVYVGQPVINEKGIVGQVVTVSAHNSRVLLITDPNAAIPVQVIRNDIRVIASGSGEAKSIQLQHIPSNTDIIQGDLLVSSGLGGVYPEGYPVAYISEVINDSHKEFALISAEPTVDFDRLRYLLLIWPTEAIKAELQLDNEQQELAQETAQGQEGGVEEQQPTTQESEVNDGE